MLEAETHLVPKLVMGSEGLLHGLQTPTKNLTPLPTSEQDELTPSRPSRLKRATNRLGIDDISLQHALTPSPNRSHQQAKLLHTPKQSAKQKLPKTPEFHRVATSEEEKGLLMRDALVPSTPTTPSNRQQGEKSGWEIAENRETPDGKFKIRIKSSAQKSSRKSPNASAPLGIFRISRRMSMEIGISPAELLAMTRSPSPKERGSAGPGVTPLIKPSPSSSSSGHTTGPVSVLKSISEGKENSTRESRSGSHVQAVQKAASVGEKRKYSPLSSRSLYNLTTSPIINRTLPPSGDQDSNDDQPPSKRPRCKASKKLY